MVKNNILYILIYVLLVGCGIFEPTDCDTDCYLKISAPTLESEYVYSDWVGDDEYYYMDYGYNNNQVKFVTLLAETGSVDRYQLLTFKSNKEIWMGNQWINLVNSSSYTRDDGTTNAVLGIWPEFIGDTITVYAGYNDWEDNCNAGIQYLDSIKVIINE
tara:strand:- start:54 stop:530 length:477 start_codon:yes stop_codon:yes gene_type:complete